MRYINIILTATMLFVAVSCNRSEIRPHQTGNKNVPDYSPLSSDEKLLAQALRQTSLIVAAIASDPDVAFEIEWAVKSGYYSDESILLKDLFYPEKSVVFNNTENKYAGKHLFSKKFAEVFASGDYPHAEEFKDLKLPAARTANALLPTDYLVQNNVQIYFPYSEEFGTTYPNYTQPANQITTTYDPLNNADGNWGEKPVRNPVKDGGSLWIYESVWVDDNYAFANRTYILNVSPDPAPARISACQPPNTCPSATIVKVGWLKSENHFGSVFKGGPKLRFVRAEGFADPNATTAQARFSETGVDLTRRDVRRRTWKQVNLIWDMDWSEAEKEQSVTVYEWDRKGSQKWTGSVKVKIGAVEAGVGFEKNLQSESSLVYTQQQPRTAFFAANLVDIGHGLRDGFTVYYSRGVYFTMPIQIIQ